MKFEIKLQAIFWRISPSLAIKLNDKTIESCNNLVNENITTISFDADLRDGDHQLIIERLNKSNTDTVVKDSKIVKDSTIDIVDVIIDEISVNALIDNANFFPKYPEMYLALYPVKIIKSLKPCFL